MLEQRRADTHALMPLRDNHGADFRITIAGQQANTVYMAESDRLRGSLGHEDRLIGPGP